MKLTRGGLYPLLALISILLMFNGLSPFAASRDDSKDNSTPEVIIVSVSGQGNHTSIQDAIDNASTGDTIRVWEGIYEERISINKTLTLIGNGSDNTTIDGGGWFDVVRITSDDVCISGFGIINCGNSFYFQDNDAGVKIQESRDCVISRCMFYNTSNDIWLEGSNNNTISENVFNSTYWNKVSIGVSNSNYNTFQNNSWTYDLNFTYYVQELDEYIILNESYITRIGLLLSSSFRNKVTSNAMLGRGIIIDATSFSHYLQQIDLSNTVGGKTIYYLENGDGVQIPSDVGQVMLIYCSNCDISDTSFENMEEGVLLVYSDNNTISNNGFSHNNWGLHLIHSNNNRILSNHFHENHEGIHIEDSIKNTVCENNLTGNVIGTHLEDCASNRIDGNILGYNTEVGLKLEGSDMNTISNCSLPSNLVGLSLESSAWNQVVNNTITGSKQKGILLFSTSSNNQIYHNNLIGNTIQVSDSGANSWSSDEDEGNYWSDYEGEDDGSGERMEGDGIGDTNLTFHGLDEYPYMEPDGWLDNEGDEKGSAEDENADEESEGDDEVLGPYGLIIFMAVFALILVVLYFWAQRR